MHISLPTCIPISSLDPAIGLILNLPTAFGGLLGPQKDGNVDFTKTVGKQTTIS